MTLQRLPMLTHSNGTRGAEDLIMSVETMCCILETIILLYLNDALILF